MANTDRHSKVACFLREECSALREESYAILGLPVGSSPADIRHAYLKKAKELHPDQSEACVYSNGADFDALHKAYQHLTIQNGVGSQSNPAHSLRLMLEVTGSVQTSESKWEANHDNNCFKARLLVVLLEYGDKGLDLRWEDGCFSTETYLPNVYQWISWIYLSKVYHWARFLF